MINNLFYFILRLFPLLGKYSSLPIVGSFFKHFVKLEPAELTQTYILNLNMDITEKGKNVILPIDMIKQIVRDSRYLVIMNSCLCRNAYDCKNFPHEHGCIFLGPEAKVIVDKGLGHESTLDEALTHIDKGAALGLVGHAMWIEVEGYIFGIKRENGVAHWLEICFCCPCCCSAFKLIKASNQTDIKERFRSIGWKAYQDNHTCMSCMKCIRQCPVSAITLKDNCIDIDEYSCLGCGLCALKCPGNAIKLKLKTSLKETILDYFAEGGLRLNI